MGLMVFIVLLGLAIGFYFLIGLAIKFKRKKDVKDEINDIGND